MNTGYSRTKATQSKPIKIYNTLIEAGQYVVIKIPVGRIPSGNIISIKAHVYRGPRIGPCMVALGGVHGDEVNGVEIVRRSIEQGVFNHLYAGTVIAIPLLNVHGFINFSRDVPDGKDVNRSFPGNANGSLASRVARIFTREILPVIDFGIDFHTGGRGHYNYPQVRFNPDHTPSIDLAQAFGAPFTIAGKPIKSSLRRTAVEINKPIIVFEGGENLRFDEFSIQQGILGMKRVMKFKGMLSEAPDAEATRNFTYTAWLRSPRSGMFHLLKSSGEQVKKDEILAYITDPFGEERTQVVAKQSGYIIGHNNTPVISQGDALFHIASNQKPKILTLKPKTRNPKPKK
jgi:hypothetical protein